MGWVVSESSIFLGQRRQRSDFRETSVSPNCNVCHETMVSSSCMSQRS